MPLQQADLVREKRLPRDLHEELGNFFGDRPQPRGQTPGKDRYGKVGRHGRLRDLEDRETSETDLEGSWRYGEGYDETGGY